MAKKMKLGIFFVAALAMLVQFSVPALAQQTLGGITGTVTDKSGSVLPDTSVTIVGDQTKLTRTLKTNSNGAYDFVNLPIGTYTITVAHEGFRRQRGCRRFRCRPTAPRRLNVTLKVGQVGTTIDVEAAPMMNAVDTTNGYVLEKAADRRCAAADREFYGAGDSFTGRECGTSERDGRERGTGESADLGERAARHQQHVSC